MSPFATVWLWPNQLALDAPLVAVVWQRHVGGRFDEPVPFAASVVLVLTVWGIYLADRWLDSRPGRSMPNTARHRFARRHSAIIGGLAVLSLATAAGVALIGLDPVLLVAGSSVGLVVVVYFLGVHGGWLAVPVGPAGGKELAVGTVFALGVLLPFLPNHGWTEWLPMLVPLAALFSFNCLLISRWEEDDGNRRPGRRLVQVVGSVALLSGIIAGRGSAFPLIMAASLLVLLDHFAGQLRPSVSRVLADSVLMTPALLWLFGGGP